MKTVVDLASISKCQSNAGHKANESNQQEWEVLQRTRKHTHTILNLSLSIAPSNIYFTEFFISYNMSNCSYKQSNDKALNYLCKAYRFKCNNVFIISTAKTIPISNISFPTRIAKNTYTKTRTHTYIYRHPKNLYAFVSFSCKYKWKYVTVCCTLAVFHIFLDQPFFIVWCTHYH